MHVRRAVWSSLLVVATVVPCCTCQRAENIAAKERLSKPAPPDPVLAVAKESIDVRALADKPEVARRVNDMSAAEMAARLGSFSYLGKGELSFLRQGEGVHASERTRFLQAQDGSFSIQVDTGDGTEQRLAFVNGVFFLKNDNGRWRMSRDPTGERNRYREDSAALWRALYDLFAHAITFAPSGEGTRAGRPVVKFSLKVTERAGGKGDSKGEQKGEAPPADGGVEESDAQRQARIQARIATWRERARPLGGGGDLWVDVERGVPLYVKFAGTLVVDDGPEPARLEVRVEQAIDDIGAQKEVRAPEDAVDEVVRKKVLVNPRGVLEEAGIVKPAPVDGGPAPAAANKKRAPAPEPPDEDRP